MSDAHAEQQMQFLFQLRQRGVRDKRVLEGNLDIEAAVKLAEQRLGGDGRILLRPSGTEPLVRVMVEGKVANDVQRICEKVAQVVQDAAA